MHPLPTLLFCALWVLVPASAYAQQEAPRRPEPPFEAAFGRGLAWMDAHPASVADGGLADMIDEGVSFYVMRNLSREPPHRTRFELAMAARMARVEAEPRFHAWVARPGKPLLAHYHLVLAAHLMQLAGRPSALQPDIVTGAREALAAMPYGIPTVRYTVAVLLTHMGEDPGIPMDVLSDASLLEAVTGRRVPIPLPAPISEYQRRVTALRLYALVHELISLTDFGRLAPPPRLAARSKALFRQLTDAIAWARSQRDVDLGAELLMTTHLLGLPFGAELGAAVRELAESQLPDGSWGASPTTTRENRVRHSVLTATGALWAYLNRGAGSAPSPVAGPAPSR